MNRREAIESIERAAELIYGREEARQMARMLLDEVAGVSLTDLVTAPEAECVIEGFDSMIRDIEAGRPIQYIIGEADFCDFRLSVREGVLIPRPESEELIRWIESEWSDPNAILDIGTGSGALAIALARIYPDADITTLDISDQAREIARENCDRLAPRVSVEMGDAVAGVERYVDGEFDIILSNPPYIPASEATTMRSNVTKYEPHIALFVDDDDPLIFYRAIARSAHQLLREGGRLYFEIHENFADHTARMLAKEGYRGVRIRRDINDKARMICAQRDEI